RQDCGETGIEQMISKITSEREVLKLTLQGGKIIAENTTVQTITEVSLKVVVNGREFVSLLCLNQYLEELSLGFLFNEGVIDCMADVRSIICHEGIFTIEIELSRDTGFDFDHTLKSVTSGCGKGLTFINPHKGAGFKPVESGFRIDAAEVLKLMRDFSSRSELYKSAGGVHSALLHHAEFELFCEDIGRHNCIDKIAGMILKREQVNSAGQGLIVSSGRISSEVMTKLVRLGIPVFASRSAPTASAVALADKYGITLIGYVRGDKMTVYSGQERVFDS
ncbi:MAG: formate dehydrogenase accessory sulfurtransferase FdhD, partial [Candidatus Wallbacteria bacterium]|nr:formate dehydrogenase accessory sulfurtransferase FdhD [Candidatus Wallbacteria bacterium]